MIVVAVAGALSWDFNISIDSMERGVSAMSIEDVGAALTGLDFSRLKRGPFRVESEIASTQTGINKRVRNRGEVKVALIVIGEKKSIAMINGEVLTTGDSINGLKVKRIERERVLLAGKKKFWQNLESR